MGNVDAEDRLYEEMCVGCMYEKLCHDSCEPCEKFLAALMKEEELDDAE